MRQLFTPLSRGGAAQFVERLRRLGPTSIKIGQYLAVRSDLLPQDYCDELLKLVDRVPPFPWAQAQAILIEELGRDPSVIFPYFEQQPIAAGSLAQVHRARLEDGTEVAVKIQRPGLAAQVAKDLRRLRLMGRLIERSDTSWPVSPREVADELGDWLLQEVDFSRELVNVQRLWGLTRDSPIQRVPRAFMELSTKRVLTYEYLEGIPVSAVLEELRSDPASRSNPSLLADLDSRRFAEHLITACLTQIFRYRFFHSDLHPGNVRILPGNVVGFVDFGLCDGLDDTVRKNQLRYVAAVYDRDAPAMFRALTEILIPSANADFEGLKRDFLAETRSLEGRSASSEEASAPERSPTAAYLNGVLRAAHRNHFKVPRRVLSLYRALLTVETLAGEFGLNDGLREVGRDFFADLRRQELIAGLFDRDRLQQMLANTLTLKQDAPAQISQIMTDLAEGTLRIKVEVSDAPRAMAAHNRRARLWACAIISVGVSILLTAPRLPDVFGFSLGWPLAGALGVLYLACFLLWRRL